MVGEIGVPWTTTVAPGMAAPALARTWPTTVCVGAAIRANDSFTVPSSAITTPLTVWLRYPKALAVTSYVPIGRRILYAPVVSVLTVRVNGPVTRMVARGMGLPVAAFVTVPERTPVGP